MARPEIVDRSPVEILIDHGGTDVRRTRNRGCIAQSLTDGAHHRGDRTLRLPLGLHRSVLGKRDSNKGSEYMLASESVALDMLGFELVRDVAPGEVVFIDGGQGAG